MRPSREPVGPDQESVWDYPRPPALAPFEGSIKIYSEDRVVADATSAYRVLETSHPPTFYVPPSAVDTNLLEPMPGQSFCEWKGRAGYFRLRDGDRVIDRVAWCYEAPSSRFAAISGYLCFYPSKVRCFVNGEGVLAQEGDFYGGWITKNVVGPFKGGPGTWGW